MSLSCCGIMFLRCYFGLCKDFFRVVLCGLQASWLDCTSSYAIQKCSTSLQELRESLVILSLWLFNCCCNILLPQEDPVVHRTVQLLLCSGFFSEQHISKLVQVQQSSFITSVCQSTFCFCCWLQCLVGSDSACWVQLQPDSGPGSEQLWELHLHHHRLQHLVGAANLLTACWDQNRTNNTTSFIFTFTF